MGRYTPYRSTTVTSNLDQWFAIVAHFSFQQAKGALLFQQILPVSDFDLVAGWLSPGSYSPAWITTPAGSPLGTPARGCRGRRRRRTGFTVVPRAAPESRGVGPPPARRWRGPTPPPRELDDPAAVGHSARPGFRCEVARPERLGAVLEGVCLRCSDRGGTRRQ